MAHNGLLLGSEFVSGGTSQLGSDSMEDENWDDNSKYRMDNYPVVQRCYQVRKHAVLDTGCQFLDTFH